MIGLQASKREILYSPEPAVCHPLALLRRMVADSWRFRQLVRRVIIRDIQAQYRQSLFGYLWAFIPSVATAVGFSLARDAQVLRIAETHIPYIVFVMVGTVLWQTFIEALNGPIDAVNNFKAVLSRIYVPPEIIILAKLGEVLINLSIKLILLAAVFLLYGIAFDTTAVLAPLLLMLLVLEGAAIGLLLTPLAVLYHDIVKGLAVVTGFWFLITPVAYPIPSGGTFSLIVKANPATPFLVAIRNAVTSGPPPDAWSLMIAGVLSILVFVFALVALRISIPFVIERSQ